MTFAERCCCSSSNIAVVASVVAAIAVVVATDYSYCSKQLFFFATSKTLSAEGRAHLNTIVDASSFAEAQRNTAQMERVSEKNNDDDDNNNNNNNN